MTAPHPLPEPQAGASARPWELVLGNEHHGPYVANSWGSSVCDCYAMSSPEAASVLNGGTSYPIPFMDADANAALIVHAVNALDPLVAALTTLRAKFHRALVVGGTDPEFADVACEQADAALRLAAPAPAREEGR